VGGVYRKVTESLPFAFPYLPLTTSWMGLDRP